MHKEKRSHRETRLQIINEWADKGAQEPRTLFSTEKRFRELTQGCPALFKPVRLLANDDVNFQREVSYLIDAFDMLPQGPTLLSIQHGEHSNSKPRYTIPVRMRQELQIASRITPR